MKKIIIFLALTFLFVVKVSSQTIFKEVNRIMRQAEAIKNDTKKNIEERKIATFKADAIFYLITKASKEEYFTELELGQQTNAMIEFVNRYIKQLTHTNKKSEKEIILAKYRTATLQNPLFNDPEKNITQAYVDNPKYLTQFSIDTDWVKAYKSIK